MDTQAMLEGTLPETLTAFAIDACSYSIMSNHLQPGHPP